MEKAQAEGKQTSFDKIIQGEKRKVWGQDDRKEKTKIDFLINKTNLKCAKPYLPSIKPEAV